MDILADDARNKVQIFVRDRLQAARDLLEVEQQARTNALKEDLGNRGFGFALDPLDPRFDDIAIWHCNALLQAEADALFEAYGVYGLPIDDLIMKELSSHRRQLVDARKGSLIAAATGRALRRGQNSTPGIARAEALGRKIERSTHAALKGLACEVEKRRNMRKEMPKESSGPNLTFNQNNQTILGSPAHVTQVAQGDSSSFSNTVSQAKGRDNVDKWLIIPATVGAIIVAIIGLIFQLHH
jgi:hypothetical protein